MQSVITGNNLQSKPVIALLFASMAASVGKLLTRNEKQRGCNDEAIRAANEEGLIKPVARTFEYVGGRVTGMPSGFFHKFPSFVENPSGGQR